MLLEPTKLYKKTEITKRIMVLMMNFKTFMSKRANETDNSNAKIFTGCHRNDRTSKFYYPEVFRELTPIDFS